MTLSDLERRDARGQFFSETCLITLVQFDLKQPKFGRERSRGQPRPLKGAGPQSPALPNLGVLYLWLHPLMQNAHVLQGNVCGDGLGVSHANHPTRAKFQRSRIVGVILHLCLHPITQNNQIRRDNTHEEGLILGQPGPPLQGGVALADPNCGVLRYLRVHGWT